MTVLIRLLTALVGFAIFASIAACFLRPRQEKSGEVALPFFLFVIGLVVSAVLMIPAVILAVIDEEPALTCFFLGCSLIGILLMMAHLNCRIFYDGQGFTVKNLFGLKKSYTYDQITGISGGSKDQHLHIGKKRILLDEIAVGRAEFLAFARKRCRALWNGRAIPQLTKSRWDLFNGHIENPGEFLFIYGLLTLFFLGYMIVAFIFILKPMTPEDTVSKQVIFVSCESQVEELLLHDGSETVYKMRHAPEALPLEKLSAICDGKTVIDIYVKEITPDEGAPYLSVEAIYENGNGIWSFEDNNALNRKESVPLLWTIFGLNAIWLLFVVISIIVGRNPHKYRRVIYLFFKPSYVRFD